MKIQVSGKVYDGTPVKRGSRKSKAPAYTAKKRPKISIRIRVMTPPTKRRNPKGKGRIQAKIALILTIVVTTETMIPPETTNKK